jgi:hypothetical protein
MICSVPAGWDRPAFDGNNIPQDIYENVTSTLIDQ